MKDTAAYMDVIQTHVLKNIDLKLLSTDDVMFRIVDASPLTPRYRVEMGFLRDNMPCLFSTMMMKDPKVVAKQLVAAFEQYQA